MAGCLGCFHGHGSGYDWHVWHGHFEKIKTLFEGLETSTYIWGKSNLTPRRGEEPQCMLLERRTISNIVHELLLSLLLR